MSYLHTRMRLDKMEQDKWTKEHKQMLIKVVEDKYAVGPFAGMVTNIASEKMNKQITPNIEKIIFQAIDVRIKMLTLISSFKTGNTEQATEQTELKKEVNNDTTNVQDQGEVKQCNDMEGF